jgi:hypothetical protein
MKKNFVIKKNEIVLRYLLMGESFWIFLGDHIVEEQIMILLHNLRKINNYCAISRFVYFLCKNSLSLLSSFGEQNAEPVEIIM